MCGILYKPLKHSSKNVGAQLSWESICLTSRGSQVRALLFPPLGPVVQLVRTPACHAGGRRFEPVPGRQFNKVADVAHLVERHLAKVEVASSSLVIRSNFWYHSQVVRPRSAKPLFPSSNLGGTSKKTTNFDRSSSIFTYYFFTIHSSLILWVDFWQSNK